MGLLLYQLIFPLIKLLLCLFPYFSLVCVRAFSPDAEGHEVLFVDYSWHREAAA